MKVTTEKLPKSLLVLQIELDKDQVERGLDKAARRLSQKYPIRGFRPGKAPRAIIERSYGRAALLEEATDDLINKAYRDALDSEKIAPVGPPTLDAITSSDPFTFRVTVPITPTIILGDYRSIRSPLEVAEVTEVDVDREMENLRDKHVALKELDEPRPAQEGDQLNVNLDTIFDGEDDDLIDEESEDEDEDDERAQTLDLVAGRLVPDLHNALIGLNAGDRTEVTTVLADDHPNESARGKTVTFKVKVKGIQERILPDWEELPALENFEGDLDELRIKTRTNMEQSVQNAAERKVIDTYIEELLSITEFDIPDVMVRELADEMLHEQGHQFERYGITLDQMLQYRGQTHDQAVDALMPDAERQTKTTLALQKLVEQEGLNVTVEDIQAEILHLAMDYDEATRESVIERLRTEMISQVANMVIDRKLRARIVEIATGVASALEVPVVTDETPAAEVPAETPAAEASVEEKLAEE